MLRLIGKYTFLLLFLIAGCHTDLQSKKWAEKNLKGKSSTVMIKGFVELGFTENRGMVFGLMNDKKNKPFTDIMLAVRIIILLGVSVFVARNRNRSVIRLLPFMLILAGAFGNIIDSVTYGHVIDFIHIHLGTIFDWPFFFNLADAYLCIGMALFLLEAIIDSIKSKTSKVPAV